MSTVLIERVRHLNGNEKRPVFADVERMVEKIQQRAFNLFQQRGGRPGLDRDDWLPPERQVLGTATAEVLKSDKKQKLRVAALGIEPKDLTVITPESLIVQAVASRSHSSAAGEVRFCEFSEGSLCRQFGLPSAIEVNTVSASLDKGALKVSRRKRPTSSAGCIRRGLPGTA